MTSDDYVILRIEESSREILGGILSATGMRLDAADVSMETRTLGVGELSELNRRGGVQAAKKMPVMLVQPFTATDIEANASTGNATWGLEAVGALTSRGKGTGVSVAILDTGINAAHVAFHGKSIEQKDFTGEGNGDLNGHGTHCAGTVCGGEISGKRIGVAPGVERILIGKVLDRHGRGSTDQILDGLLWAAREGANVISISLGLDFPGYVAHLIASGRGAAEATSIALEAYRQNVRLFDTVAALARAHSAMFSRCIVVAAAGNESKRPNYEIGVAPPAAADGIMAVGALGRTTSSRTGLIVADFSNSGPAVSAPGVAIESATHDSNDGSRTLSGTSMATPHVAGVAALWFEELNADNPNFEIGELEANLRARALKNNVFADGVDPDDRGAGLVQAPQP